MNQFSSILRRWSVPAVLSALLLCVSAVRAQVLTWDPLHTQAAGGSDGSGTWSTTAGTKNPTNWVSGTDQIWSDNNTASIGTAAGNGLTNSIAIKVAVTVNNLTFNQMTSGGYLLTGSSTVTFLGGTNEIDNTAQPTVYYKLIFGGAVGFTKTGNGTLIFDDIPVPTFTGALHVAAGTLQIVASDWIYSPADLRVDTGAMFDIAGRNGTVGALIGGGTVNNSVASLRTITFGNADSGEFDGVIESSAGAADMKVVKMGAGTEIFGGANTYTGTTVVSNTGALLLSGSGSLAASAVSVLSGATFGGCGTVGGPVTYSSGALASFTTTNANPMVFSGALALNNNVVHLTLPASLPTGSYTLATYAGTLTGTFNSTPVIDSGSIAGGGIPTIVTGGGTVTLNAQACTPAGVSQSPANTTAFLTGNATFTVTATGASPTYQWQVDPTGTGSSFANVTDGSGATTATYTTHTLSSADNNTLYRCVVSVACDSTTANSSAATLTVVDPSTYSFRTSQSGNWSDPSTWQQSANGGGSWSAATSTPFAGNASILIQSGHTVTVTAPVTIDHTTIQSGGEVDVSGAILTITGTSSPDVSVAGILTVTGTAGSGIAESGTPSVVFANGSSYSLAQNGGAIPIATWAANSTCTYAPAVAGTNVPSGLSQTFGNFAWTWAAQNNSVNLQGVLTNIQGNFDVTAGNSFVLTTKNDASTYTLTVGGAINVHSGSGKLAVAGGAPTGVYDIITGGGVVVDTGATFDVGNGGTTHNETLLEFTGTNAVWNIAGTFSNGQNASWKVDGGATLTLDTSITSTQTLASVTVNGTLSFNANTITFAGTVTSSGTGTLIGNGPSPMVAGTGTIVYGGTLNINQASLTGLTDTQVLQLFTGTTYSGSFSSIVPATPPGFAGWVNNLDSNGSLVVSSTGGGGGGIKITSVTVSGSNLVLSGTGGTASTAFSVIGSSSLTVPRSSWSTVTSGTTDTGGNFSIEITGAVTSGTMTFYSIKQ